MPITITFENDLAERLEREAIHRNVSAEELAVTIVDQAVPRCHSDWSQQNQRRLTLIRKSLRQSLTPNEQKELDDLQAALDSRFQDFDAGLHQQLDFIQSAIERLPNSQDE
jgi:hypothetical protein